MFAKAATVFALFIAAAQVAVATPPACLVAGVNTQPNPGDVSAVCKNATAVEQFICSSCGSNIQNALSAFSSYCGNAGVTVSTSSNTCSSSSNNSSSSSTTGTATGVVTGTAHSTATSTGAHSTGTGSAATTHTMATSTVTGKTTAATTGTEPPSASSTSATTSAAAPKTTSNAAAPVARLGMDLVGMAALGMFGAMLAM